MTHRIITLPLMLALAGAPLMACSPDPGPGDNVGVPPEDDVVGRRVVRGEIADDGPAIEGQGRFDSATEARVVSVAPDGSSQTHGTASIDANGRFEIEAEGMTRTFLVEARDAEGRLVAAAIAIAELADEEVVEAGRLTAETSVEARIWAEVIAEAGYDLVTSAEVRARIDAATADAVHVWRRGHGDLRAGFDGLASAIVAAATTREDAVVSSGASLDADARSRVRAHVLDASTEGELALALDAAFEAEGVGPEVRSEAAGRADAALRAAAEVAFDASESSGEEVLRGLAMASARVEARGHAAAWAALSAAADAETSVAVEVAAALDAFADARERGTDNALALRADLDALLWASVEATLPDSVAAEVLLELGLDANADASAAAAALVELLTEIRGEVAAEVRAAAAASASERGVDARAMASASGEAWSDAETRVERIAARLSSRADARAALHVLATALVVID
jgi:hypothetical protein